jgi:hypothetical protein
MLPARSRWDQGLTAADMKKSTWLSQCWFARSSYGMDAGFRPPVFLDFKKDKTASEVVREIAR